MNELKKESTTGLSLISNIFWGKKLFLICPLFNRKKFRICISESWPHRLKSIVHIFIGRNLENPTQTLEEHAKSTLLALRQKKKSSIMYGIIEIPITMWFAKQ